MNDAGWVFVFTPLPWLAAMYVAAYRYDLARIAKPFRDHDDQRAWWSVCSHLGLVEDGMPRPARKVWKSKSLLALLAVSLVCLIGPPILAPLGWYYLVACQIASAVCLFFVLVAQLGPIPPRPYADTLRYPRLGSRVRHLEGEKGTGRTPVVLPTKGASPT